MDHRRAGAQPEPDGLGARREPPSGLPPPLRAEVKPRAQDAVRLHGDVRRIVRLRMPLCTLDRYLISELGGPFLFGLSAFTLIFAAVNLLALSRLVSEEHAPLIAAVEYFFWQLPSVVVLVIPMALLLGTLLALQRLAGDSEITAMKAGGISLVRISAPLLVVGLVLSVVALLLQEGVVPFAQDRATFLLNEVIKHVGLTNRDLTVTTALPGGGRQLTAATSFEASTSSLRNVTVIQYDRQNRPQEIIFSDSARYEAPSWTFTNANTYHFQADGTTIESVDPTLRVDIGERPSQLVQRVTHDNPDEMSRAQIRETMASGQLSPAERQKYQSAYDSKLARPFACFVFTLIAIPFGLRQTRGGSATGLGFGLAVLIVFVYYVVATVFLSIGQSALSLSQLGAWAPNVIFTCIGVLLLRRAASV
jgi:lipopolysaccharide export system permease protein